MNSTAVKKNNIVRSTAAYDWQDFVRLVRTVERVIRHEKKEARHALKSTIPQIRSSRPFTYYPVVYLPPEGTALFMGDTHGDSISITSMLRQENFFQRIKRKEKLYLILLGDYADRGKEDIKTLGLIFQLKRYYPYNVFLIRGNHEEITMSQHYGLLGSCIRQFGYDKGQYVLERLSGVFEHLPGIVVTGNGIVGVHGGVPIRPIHSLRELNNEEELEEIRWNDPSEDVDHYIYNHNRGGHYIFGRHIFDQFMRVIGGQVMVRSHEYVARGYKLMFDDQLLTIFSNGGASPESGYQDFIIQPKYCRVNLKEPIQRWKQKHIRTIKYTS